MLLTPESFIKALQNGAKEIDLNKLSDTPQFNSIEIQKLIKYGHTLESAKEHLNTDYTNGFTICANCGSYYHLGKGFTKHLSNGCLHCEGEAKHRCYHVNASRPSEGGFPARWMSNMFDDKMSYCKDNIQIEKYKEQIKKIKNLA